MKSIGTAFKSFAVYNHSIDTSKLAELSDDGQEPEDPVGASWDTKTLVRPSDAEEWLFLNLDGLGKLFCVQFNERILPGKVIRERVDKAVAVIAERDGRKPGKKQCAEIRDDIILELLPKAFIKRSRVYGFISGSKLFIFTGSAKRQDDVMGVLIRALEKEAVETVSFARPMLRDPVVVMTGIALNGNDYMLARSDALLRIETEGKPTIRVKDKEIH